MKRLPASMKVIPMGNPGRKRVAIDAASDARPLQRANSDQWFKLFQVRSCCVLKLGLTELR